MFSAITIKQLQNTLSIFEKNKATEKIYINDVEFEVERKEKKYLKSTTEVKAMKLKSQTKILLISKLKLPSLIQ